MWQEIFKMQVRQSIMPLAAPIGSNKGLCSKDFIQILIDEIDLPIIVDAGISKPSEACEAMEMGAAAIMANTAIAAAGDIPAMAESFRLAIEAGRSLSCRNRKSITAGRKCFFTIDRLYSGWIFVKYREGKEKHE